mmetsp:Transcript_7733/g.47983  ORF Transcript_7733/g.47983 Transcript_7733/m.47983 type:complete len:156 (+) Transcript_7733:188-655(+)
MQGNESFHSSGHQEEQPKARQTRDTKHSFQASDNHALCPQPPRDRLPLSRSVNLHFLFLESQHPLPMNVLTISKAGYFRDKSRKLPRGKLLRTRCRSNKHSPSHHQLRLLPHTFWLPLFESKGILLGIYTMLFRRRPLQITTWSMSGDRDRPTLL